MALNPKLAVARRNAALDNILANLNNGTIKIYDGTQPSDADTLSVNEEQQTKAQINKESISEVKEESSQTLIKEIKQEVKEEVVDLLPKLIKDIIFTQPQQISKQFVSESPKTKIKTPLKSHKVQQKEYLKNLIFEAWKDF
jgi:hypothetical protein